MLIDLSHALSDGLVTYPGLPPVHLGAHLSREDSRAKYAPGTEFHIAKVEMVVNSGTYLDTPFHRYPNRMDVAALPLERVAFLPALVVDATMCGRAVPSSLFADVDVHGKAVLVRTDWSRHFGTPQYGSGHPFLTLDAATLLLTRGASFVGIDSLNIDDTSMGAREVHSLLLANDVLIVEHLTNLAALPPGAELTFFAVPVRVEGAGTFPVRAFGRVG